MFSLVIPGIILGYRLYFVSKQVTDVVTVKDSSQEIVYQLKNLGIIIDSRHYFNKLSKITFLAYIVPYLGSRKEREGYKVILIVIH